MKVLFITKNYPPAVCGVGDYTSKLASEFVRNAHSIHVLTEQASVQSQESVSLHSVIQKWNVFAIPKILRICKSVAPDIISMQYVPYSFSNKGVPFWLILLYALFKIKGYNVVTTFHEVGIRYTENNIKRKVTATAQFFIARLLSKLSVKNITSIDLYVSYLKRYTREVYKIPIGANILASFASSNELSTLKTKVAPNGEFIISSFGTRISDVILYTLAELKKEGCYVKLLLLGNLPKLSRDAFQKTAETLDITDDIYITGYLEEAGLFNYLKISSLFVMAEYVSAKGEGGIAAKSGSLAAAFAAGLPILGTRGDTTDHIFEDNRNIFLMDEYSIKNTQQRIKEIIEDPTKTVAVSKHAKETFSNYFSWEMIYEKYLKVYSECK